MLGLRQLPVQGPALALRYRKDGRDEVALGLAFRLDLATLYQADEHGNWQEAMQWDHSKRYWVDLGSGQDIQNVRLERHDSPFGDVALELSRDDELLGRKLLPGAVLFERPRTRSPLYIKSEVEEGGLPVKDSLAYLEMTKGRWLAQTADWDFEDGAFAAGELVFSTPGRSLSLYGDIVLKPSIRLRLSALAQRLAASPPRD